MEFSRQEYWSGITILFSKESSQPRDQTPVYDISRISKQIWHPTPVLLPGKSHGQWNLVGYSPWGLKEWNTIELLHFHFLYH